MPCVCEYEAGGGFGVFPFGTGSFGTESPDALALTGESRALTANQVVVAFEGDVGLPNPFNPSSPLSPSAWTLVALEPPDATVRLIQSVALVTADTLPVLLGETPQLVTAPLPSFLISFDGPLQEGAEYRLDLNVAGVALSGCGCAEFVSVVLRRDARLQDARDSDGFVRDVANPVLNRDALRFPPRLGTYQITDRGDVGLDKSLESGLRKRILRRAMAELGSFFHLPRYGTGLEIKGLLTVDRVQRLQSRLRAQVLKEPEVVAARVQVFRVQGSPNVVSAVIRVSTGGGDPVSVVVPIELP